MRFEGRVAVVTGAARGQGAETARRLVAEGARVVLADGYAAWLGLDPERRLPAQPAAGAVARGSSSTHSSAAGHVA